MHIELILGFSLAAFLNIVSPGPAVLLAMRNGMAGGWRDVLYSSLGNVTGLGLLSGASMLGLGLVLYSSSIIFLAVKIMGALYLFYLGYQHLRGRASFSLTDGARIKRSAWQLYREAFGLAVTNPKPILFFTALFPQFIDPSSPLLPQFSVLTAIFMIISLITQQGYALLARRGKGLFRRPRIMLGINRAVGSVFIAFGLFLLVLKRPVA